jgi:hypothetical protein
MIKSDWAGGVRTKDGRPDGIIHGESALRFMHAQSSRRFKAVGKIDLDQGFIFQSEGRFLKLAETCPGRIGIILRRHPLWRIK